MRGPRKFRTRPVTVEAMQHDGSQESAEAIIEWTRGSETYAYLARYYSAGKGEIDVLCLITPDDGKAAVQTGAWVVRTAEDEFRLQEEPEFRATYEAELL